MTINTGDLEDFSIPPNPITFITNSAGTIGNNYSNVYAVNPTIAQDLFAFFRSVGAYTQNQENSGDSYDVNRFNAYIFNVTWAAGSTVTSGLVRMSYDSNYGSLYISTVDPTNTAYETSNPSNVDPGGATIPGTFNFPATFTLRTPVIQSGGTYWC